MKREAVVPNILVAMAVVVSFTAGPLAEAQMAAKSIEPVVSSWKTYVELRPVRLQAPPRKSCEEYYPEPDDAVNWTNCIAGYRSACGGPDQCYCDASERLVDYKCAEGTYSICQLEENNGCQ